MGNSGGGAIPVFCKRVVHIVLIHVQFRYGGDALEKYGVVFIVAYVYQGEIVWGNTHGEMLESVFKLTSFFFPEFYAEETLDSRDIFNCMFNLPFPIFPLLESGTRINLGGNFLKVFKVWADAFIIIHDGDEPPLGDAGKRNNGCIFLALMI